MRNSAHSARLSRILPHIKCCHRVGPWKQTFSVVVPTLWSTLPLGSKRRPLFEFSRKACLVTKYWHRLRFKPSKNDFLCIGKYYFTKLRGYFSGEVGFYCMFLSLSYQWLFSILEYSYDWWSYKIHAVDFGFVLSLAHVLLSHTKQIIKF